VILSRMGVKSVFSPLGETFDSDTHEISTSQGIVTSPFTQKLGSELKDFRLWTIVDKLILKLWV
jgi:hypothetical protein